MVLRVTPTNDWHYPEMTMGTHSNMSTLKRFLTSFGTSLIMVYFNQLETGKLNHLLVLLLNLIRENFSQIQLIGKTIRNSKTERMATFISLILARAQDRLTVEYILCFMVVAQRQNTMQNMDTMTLQLQITL